MRHFLNLLTFWFWCKVTDASIYHHYKKHYNHNQNGYYKKSNYRTHGSVQNTGAFTTQSIDKCMQECDKEPETCQSFDVLRENSFFLCILNNSVGKYVSKQGWLHYIKQTSCSGYCANVPDLCGSCSCHDTCGKHMPYYCDCRTNQKVIQETCESIYISNDEARSGIYNINPDGLGNITVFCERKSNAIKHNSMVVLKRYKDDFFTPSQHENPFGELSGSHWFGLENLYRVTSKFSVSLKIDFVTAAKSIKSLLYENFQVFNKESSYKFTYSSYTELSGKSEDFLEDYWKLGTTPFNKNSFYQPYELKWGKESLLYLKLSVFRSEVLAQSSPASLHSCDEVRRKELATMVYYNIKPDYGSSIEVFCYKEHAQMDMFVFLRGTIDSCTYSKDEYIEGFHQKYYWTGFRNMFRLTKRFKTGIAIKLCSRGHHNCKYEFYKDFDILDDDTYQINYTLAKVWGQNEPSLTVGDTLKQCGTGNWWWKCFSNAGRNVDITSIGSLRIHGFIFDIAEIFFLKSFPIEKDYQDLVDLANV